MGQARAKAVELVDYEQQFAGLLDQAKHEAEARTHWSVTGTLTLKGTEICAAADITAASQRRQPPAHGFRTELHRVARARAVARHSLLMAQQGELLAKAAMLHGAPAAPPPPAALPQTGTLSGTLAATEGTIGPYGGGAYPPLQRRHVARERRHTTWGQEAKLPGQRDLVVHSHSPAPQGSEEKPPALTGTGRAPGAPDKSDRSPERPRKRNPVSSGPPLGATAALPAAASLETLLPRPAIEQGPGEKGIKPRTQLRASFPPTAAGPVPKLNTGQYCAKAPEKPGRFYELPAEQGSKAVPRTAHHFDAPMYGRRNAVFAGVAGKMPHDVSHLLGSAEPPARAAAEGVHERVADARLREQYWRKRLAQAMERLRTLNEELAMAQLEAAALHGAVTEAIAAFERMCRSLMVPSALPQTGRLATDPAPLAEARHGLDACLIERTMTIRAIERFEAEIKAEETAERHARHELQAVSEEHVLLLTASKAEKAGGWVGGPPTHPRGGGWVGAGGKEAFDDASAAIDPHNEEEMVRCATSPAHPHPPTHIHTNPPCLPHPRHA